MFKNITILFLGGLIVLTVFFAIKASSQGANLVDLEEESSRLVQENQELKDKIVKSTSLSQIAKQAENMGMVKPENYVYMSNQGIALR
jgi:hypothetical protein